MIFSLNIRGQTMDFGRKRGFLVGVVFYDLLDGAKGSHNHRDCCCFEPPHSLNLDFQVFVFGKLFRGFDWGVGVEGYSHVNEKAGFIPLVLKLSVRPISCYGPVSVDGHAPQTLSFSATVRLGSCWYHRSFTLMPNSLQTFQCICAAALLWRWI